MTCYDPEGQIVEWGNGDLNRIFKLSKKYDNLQSDKDQALGTWSMNAIINWLAGYARVEVILLPKIQISKHGLEEQEKDQVKDSTDGAHMVTFQSNSLKVMEGQYQFINGLEELLNQLVLGDTDTARIRTATSTLNNNFYSIQECVPALVHILSSSEKWQVRQLAAVELKKRSSKWWSKLDANQNLYVKNQLLQVILQEPENLVRHATARVISAIGKIELPSGSWNELFQFLYQCCQSPLAIQREIGIFIVFSLLEVTEVFVDNLRQLLQMFAVALNDPESKNVRVTTLQALGKVAEFIEQMFRDMIPSMINVLQQCLNDGDNDSVIKGFELIDSLLLVDTPLISHHFPQLIEFVLAVASQPNYDESIRVMALQFLILAKVQRLKLIGPIIQHLMPIGTENDPEDMDEESPSRMAFRVINTLSTKLPPQQIFPIVMDYVTAYTQNPDPRYRKAGMMAFAVLIEGCADYMTPKFDELFLLVCNGLRDPEVIVRRGSCIALGYELDHKVASKHAILLPLIFELMNETNNEILKQACNALDSILEGLNDEILQYLPTLMEKLIILLDNGVNELKATVAAAIGSAAHASGEGFKSYFPQVISRLKILMTLSQTNENLLLRGIAIDTVGAIAESVALESCLMDSARLRECSYCLFAVFSRIFKEEFSPYLSTIVPQLIKSCQMEENDLFKNLSSDIDIEEDDDENGTITINSAIVDEKEVASDAIGEIFENTRSHFLPYVDSSLQELIKLSNYHSESVRKTAVGSLIRFLITFYSMSNPVQWEPGLNLKVPLHENVANMVKVVMPTILTIWGDEECKKALCQEDNGDDEGLLDDEEEAECDALLINSTSDLVAAMASVMGVDFVPFFKEYLPYITKYYKKSKPIADRSMAIGCLGESTAGLKSGISEFTEQLLPLYLKALNDEEEEVRSNAAYAIGLLCQYTNVDISSQSALNVTDNACGAALNHIPELLNIFAQVLSSDDQLKEPTKLELIELIKALNQQFPDLVANSPLALIMHLEQIVKLKQEKDNCDEFGELQPYVEDTTNRLFKYSILSTLHLLCTYTFIGGKIQSISLKDTKEIVRLGLTSDGCEILSKEFINYVKVLNELEKMYSFTTFTSFECNQYCTALKSKNLNSPMVALCCDIIQQNYFSELEMANMIEFFLSASTALLNTKIELLQLISEIALLKVFVAKIKVRTITAPPPVASPITKDLDDDFWIG
ncbi:454_t:CDS:10 [Diversispora eburnea]|uniref:454_t:CDS:1 n=1 Tax=Diversispora eburnea TaxID=1213867 RepID=A0A9N9A2P9_9GLOM|nr:454_t:CDS:10 [Diversispora eburnea]